MRTNRSRPTSAATLAIVIGLSISPGPAQAQGLFPWEWNWGGQGPFGSQAKAAQSNIPDRAITHFPRRYEPGHIVVSFTDRRLYYVHRRGTALAYPIAIPRRQSRWQGTLNVSQKRTNPPWTPTEEMRRENPSLPAHVPGGHPQNPLGSHALYLGSSLYRIHGTDAPWTIGKAVSKGCVRMLNEDVQDLYQRVPVGTTVTVTWQSFHMG